MKKLYISRWDEGGITINFCEKEDLDYHLDSLANPEYAESIAIPEGAVIDEPVPILSKGGWAVFKMDVERFKNADCRVINFTNDEGVKQRYEDALEWANEHKDDEDARKEVDLLKPFIVT